MKLLAPLCYFSAFKGRIRDLTLLLWRASHHRRQYTYSILKIENVQAKTCKQITFRPGSSCCWQVLPSPRVWNKRMSLGNWPVDIFKSGRNEVFKTMPTSFPKLRPSFFRSLASSFFARSIDKEPGTGYTWNLSISERLFASFLSFECSFEQYKSDNKQRRRSPYLPFIPFM